MTLWHDVVCPVCRRLIATSDIKHIAHAHADKAGHPCPMSGKPVC
jgi:hypothetical protein